MTICPPKDSNTALYHDLVQAGNETLSDEKRDTLKKAAYEIFLEQSHHDFVNKMSTTLNMGNTDQILQGFHSLPLPYLHLNGLKVEMWNLNGTITSPWYKSGFRRDYYKKDIDYYMVLKLPKDIRDYKGPLHIEIEADLREEEGWHEKLKYAFADVGPNSDYSWVNFSRAFKFHYTGKSWSEAEAECSKEGGHLASVDSEEMNKELQTRSRYAGGGIWLGGKSLSGAWGWSDNSSWGYTNWEEGKISISDEHCTILYVSNGRWATRSCDGQYSFICQVDSPFMRGTETVFLKYQNDQSLFPSFHVWYQYKATTQQLLDNWEDKRMTGFRFSWKIDKPPLTARVNEIGRTIKSPELGCDVEKREDEVYKVVCPHQQIFNKRWDGDIWWLS